MSNKRTVQVSITELESAINYWRSQHPSSRDTMTLCPEAACLAELYARMIVFQMASISSAEFNSKAKKALQQAQKAQ